MVLKSMSFGPELTCLYRVGLAVDACLALST